MSNFLKKIFEKILFNKFFVRLYNYYKETHQVDFQKNHMLEKLYSTAADETYDYFENDLKKTLFSLTKDKIRKYSIKLAMQDSNSDELFLECGVLNGDSINLFASFLKNKNKEIYGFDTFSGFDSNWPGSHLDKSFFNLKGSVPKVLNNVKIVQGRVEDTFEKFVEEKNKIIKFLHLDVDFYESTSFVLNKSKKFFRKNTYILLDDFANYPGWKNGTFKALNENLPRQSYEIVSFGVFRSSTILIRILDDN